MNRPTWRAGIVWMLIFILVVLHHDFWQWDRTEPLLLGWAPVGLWYHVIYSLACIAVIYLLGRWVWPEPPDFDSSTRAAHRAAPPGTSGDENAARSRP